MSVLRRARALARAGHTIEILIDSFSPGFEDITGSLRRDGILEGGRITLRNMYGDLALDPYRGGNQGYSSPLGSPSEGWNYVQDSSRPDVWRGAKNGDYKHFVWMRGAKVNGIDTLSKGKRLHRTWYNSVGRPCKVERMSSDDRPHLIEYIDSSGSIYLQESRSPSGTITNIALHTPRGIRNFASQSTLIHYWLLEIVFKDTNEPTVISEYGFHRTALQKLESQKSASVIYTIHNNHHAAPFSLGSPLRPEQRDFLDHLSEYKAVVVLTDEQRNDLTTEFGNLDNLHVIPHHVPTNHSQEQFERDPHRVVMIGRYHHIKGQAEAIRSFVKVAKNHPNASLHLFGRGPEEENLRKLVESLNLRESVYLHGFTTNAFQEFSKASISVVASSYEGFCLSLVESMSVGCVPVTYDFKYGPSDLVTHGQDGLIVKHGNTQDLADALIRLLGDQDHLQRMSREALGITKRLSEEMLVKNWNDLLSRTSHKSSGTGLPLP